MGILTLGGQNRDGIRTKPPALTPRVFPSYPLPALIFLFFTYDVHNVESRFPLSWVSTFPPSLKTLCKHCAEKKTGIAVFGCVCVF